MNIHNKRQIFFNNLLVLGLDKTSVERECKLKCDKDIFAVPNQKMFEFISHFLFSKLNSIEKHKYPIIWPILERSQHRVFLKTCFTHLTSISQESNVRFPRFTFSMLQNAFGDQLYSLYFAFSTHVVERCLNSKKTPKLSRPILSSTNYHDLKSTLQLSIVTSAKKVSEIIAVSKRHFEIALQMSKLLVSQQRKLETLKKSCFVELQKKMEQIISLFSSEGVEDLESAENKIQDYQTKIKGLWDKLLTFCEKEEQLWNILKSEVEDSSVKYKLEGSKCRSVVSDPLFKETHEDIFKSHCHIQDNEKFDMLRFLKILKKFLDIYIQQIGKCNISKIQSTFEEGELSQLREYSSSLQSTMKSIEALQPVVQKEVESLQNHLFIDEGTDAWEDTVREFEGVCDKKIKIPDSMVLSDLSQLRITDSDLDMSSQQASNSIFHSTSRLSKNATVSNAFYTESSASCVNRLGQFTPKVNHTTIKNSKLEDCANDPYDSAFHETNSRFKDSASESAKQSPNSSGAHSDVASLDLSYNFTDRSRRFKMRESWNLVESLDGVTFPDALDISLPD